VQINLVGGFVPKAEAAEKSKSYNELDSNLGNGCKSSTSVMVWEAFRFVKYPIKIGLLYILVFW
jgi:hypothetical protein